MICVFLGGGPGLPCRDMDRVIHETLGGSISYDGSGRLRCEYAGKFISGMILLGLIVFGGMSVAVLGLLVTGVMKPVPAIGAMTPAVLFSAYWTVLLRIRWRRMGTFVVDTKAGVLQHLRGSRLVQQWPLSDVRFGTAWDPFHRGWGLHYWLTARVEPHRRLRLGKGTRAELEPVLRLMRDLGLNMD